MTGVFKKRVREYSEKEAMEDAKIQEYKGFCRELNNSRMAVNKIASRMPQSMSQEFVCLEHSHFLREGLDSPEILYIIFRDGFVYECIFDHRSRKVRAGISDTAHKGDSAFGRKEQQKTLLLKALKEMEENGIADCATGKGYLFNKPLPFPDHFRY